MVFAFLQILVIFWLSAFSVFFFFRCSCERLAFSVLCDLSKYVLNWCVIFQKFCIIQYFMVTAEATFVGMPAHIYWVGARTPWKPADPESHKLNHWWGWCLGNWCYAVEIWKQNCIWIIWWSVSFCLMVVLCSDCVRWYKILLSLYLIDTGIKVLFVARMWLLKFSRLSI